MVKIPPIYGDLGHGLLLFYPHYLGNRLKEHVLFWEVFKQIQARIMGWANRFFYRPQEWCFWETKSADGFCDVGDWEYEFLHKNIVVFNAGSQTSLLETNGPKGSKLSCTEAYAAQTHYCNIYPGWTTCCKSQCHCPMAFKPGIHPPQQGQRVCTGPRSQGSQG